MKKFLSVLLITIITILSFPVTEYADENSYIYVINSGNNYNDYGYNLNVSIDDGLAGIDIIKYRPGDAFNETLDYATFYFSTKKRYISNILINGTSVYSCNLSYLEVEKGNHKKIKAKDLNLNTGDQLNLNYDSDSKEYKGSIKCFKVKANNRKIDIDIKTSKAMLQVTNVTRDINKVVVPTSKINYFTTPKWKIKGKYKNYSKKSKCNGTYCLFTWKKAKLNKRGKSEGIKFKGYEVYRRENAKYWYENGKKKYAWTKVKTVKKKNNYYKLLQAIKGSDIRLKVRAYGVDKNNNSKYGCFSKVLKKKNSIGLYNKKYFYDKFGSEDVFNYQNRLRERKNSSNLIWSDDLYQICIKRSKRNLSCWNNIKGYSAHSYHDEDINNYFKEKGFKDFKLSADIDENAIGSYKFGSTVHNTIDVINNNKNDAHYKTMMANHFSYGSVSINSLETNYVLFATSEISAYINKNTNVIINIIEAKW